MIDLKNRYEEGVHRVRDWRNRYSITEYPHKVVLNMMYRAYTMSYIWNEFKTDKLPTFTSMNDAFIYMDKHYGEIAATYIQPNLLGWLQNNPTKEIGTLVYLNYEKIASDAEGDKSKKEELEFSYLFNLIQDYCVLYFIAIRLCGKSLTDTIALMTNYMIEDIPQIDYSIAKQVFLQLYVSKFMHEHYSPLP